MNTYTIGQQVESKSFGHGVVNSIEGPFMVVAFTETGIRRILAKSFVEGTYVAPTAQPAEVEVERTKSIVTAQDIYHMGQGVWSTEFTNAMAEIAANSTGIAVDIAAKFKKYHTITIAQAQVLARVATANNITL